MGSQCSDQERLEHSVSPAYTTIAPPSSSCRSGSSSPIGRNLEGPLIDNKAHHGTGKESTNGGRSRVTINMLPDVALLRIFEFYLYKKPIEAWRTLVHVSRNWRIVIFGSPRRLDLRLYCNARTPVREILDVWPPLPIVLWSVGHEKRGVENILAALEHNDRICKINLLDLPISRMESVLAAMQRPFPLLAGVYLQSRDETTLVDPDSFLGGSAPLLKSLWLDHVPFPSLPKLLMSATQLVDLDLRGVPDSGYISPEAMATGLSALTRLETLEIEFESLQSRLPPPPTRALLPALTLLRFKGVSGYLEDLVARNDAPLLDNLDITISHPLLFDTPQLTQFIGRTPKLKTHNQARVVFYSDFHIWVTLPQTFDGRLRLGISCSDADLSSVAQICGSSFPRDFLPPVEHLYIIEGLLQLLWPDVIETGQWLEILHPFTAVKSLYISQEFTPRFAPVLQELVGERVTEVLPALQTLFLEETPPSEPVREAIGQFVAARQLAGHSIAVSRWEYEDMGDEFDT